MPVSYTHLMCIRDRGYPFRGRPMVFAFAVLIVWAMFLAAWAPLIGWIATVSYTHLLDMKSGENYRMLDHHPYTTAEQDHVTAVSYTHLG